jgi:hypothetical protein
MAEFSGALPDHEQAADLFRAVSHQASSWVSVQALVVRDVSVQMQDRLGRSAQASSDLLSVAADELQSEYGSQVYSTLEMPDDSGLGVIGLIMRLRDRLNEVVSVGTMRQAAEMVFFLDGWRLDFALRMLDSMRAMLHGHDPVGYWPSAVRESREALLVSTGLLNALDSEEEVRASVERVRDLESAAQESAGNAGAADLSIHFGEYADRELRLSFWFRAATFVGLGSSVGAAYLIHLAITDASISSLIYRVTLTVGIAGLAAYFARLGGQHRRLGNWARSVQVQLKSLAAFTATITDDGVRNQVQQEFARRVLGAPPERAAGGNDQVSIPVAEILTFLNKQTS